jgi:hypothetical protein
VPRFLFALFVLLHGVVHLWYVTLSQRLVTFQPEMGWSGESWLFTDLLGDAATRSVASLLFVLATLGFAAGSAAILFQEAWWRPYYPPRPSSCSGMEVWSCWWKKGCSGC